MNEMMNAVVFKAIGQFELTQKPIPKYKKSRRSSCENRGL